MIAELHQYDMVSCDHCGEKIQGGHTRLASGQILHHECADEYENSPVARCQSPSCQRIIYESDEYVKIHNSAMHLDCAYGGGE